MEKAVSRPPFFFDSNLDNPPLTFFTHHLRKIKTLQDRH